jgi:hypothetical protein
VLTAIAILHLHFPGFMPKNPPVRPPVPVVQPFCHNTACLGGRLR